MSAPIFDMLERYAKIGPVPFHMPGHLMGRGLPDILKNAGLIDITEIPGSDCLHDPEGVILEAQTLAARLFGAERTLFLINGSTVGVHAMIRSAVKPGEKILAGRDSHRSVLNAIAISGADPVFVMPGYDDKENLVLGYDVESIKEALSTNNDVKAVILTRPNYFGIATKLEAIADLVHSKNIPLLIDEAHGAHFCFSNALPSPSLKLGADACVQSLHKTLPALTQTALLHVSKDSLISHETLFEQVSMFQTTSPSYILMASIDIAREMLEKEGEALYASLQKKVKVFDNELETIRGVNRIGLPRDGYDTDFTRIVLSFKECGLSGLEAERILRESSLIYPEMADSNNVVLIATPFHSETDFAALAQGIKKAVIAGRGPVSASRKPFPRFLPEKRLSISEALGKERETILLAESEGKTSVTAITPYPPGIPLIYPGETISREVILYANEILDSGGKVHGIMDYRVQVAKEKTA